MSRALFCVAAGSSLASKLLTVHSSIMWSCTWPWATWARGVHPLWQESPDCREAGQRAGLLRLNIQVSQLAVAKPILASDSLPDVTDR